MKTSLRVIILALCLPVLSLAAGGLTFGGGLNSSFTNADDNGDAEYTNRIGFNLGIGYEVELVPGFAYVPELNLETRGEVFKEEDTPFGDVESHLRLLYLEIPVFLMVKVPVGVATLDFFAGPALGIVLSAKQENKFDGVGRTRDVKDLLDPLDFGIEMGLGLEAPVGRTSFFVRPGYYVGLNNIDGPGDQDESIYTRNLKLKVGCKLPI